MLILIRLIKSFRLKISLSLVMIALTIFVLSLANRTSCRCNVILIVSSALSSRHMSLYGYGRQTTPFMDQYFGKSGVIFSNASSNSSWTVPSFASLFTSQNPREIQVETFADKLADNVPTFVESLRQDQVSLLALPRGAFQAREVKDQDGNLKPRQFGIFERFQENELIRAGNDDQMFRSALEWVKEREIRNQSAKPFFVLMQAMAVHSPYDPPPAFRKIFAGPDNYPGSVTPDDLTQAGQHPLNKDQVERFELQYDQGIRFLDESLKKFVNSLPEKVKKETTIIVVSDHGEAFGEHGLLEHGTSLYQEMLDIPIAIHSPSLSAKQIDAPVSLIDLAPTILDLLGLKPPSSFQGRSLIPIANSGTGSEQIVRSQRAKNTLTSPQDIARGYYPQVRTSNLETGQISSRLSNWKLIENPDQSFELYDLSSDPNELINLIGKISSLPKNDQQKIQILSEDLRTQLSK